MRVRQVTSALGGVRLSVAEFGEPGRRGLGAAGDGVLLVHGFTGGKEEFTDLATGLAGHGGYAAAVDLRGHGSSDQPSDGEAYDLAAFVADIEGTADALGWSTFALVGHSMGGAVAQRFALDHPGRVERMVLMSTFHGPVDVDAQLLALGMAIVRQGGMEALNAAQAVRREGDPAAKAARARMEAARPGYGEWSDRRLLRCSPHMWLAMAPRFPAWPDTRAELKALTVPTLVLVGSEDQTMRPQCEALAGALPEARLEVIDGVRHSPHLEAPRESLAAVTVFLRGGGSTR